MTVDHTMPDGRWEFDADVTAAFDDMLARSIPDYNTMRAIIADWSVRCLSEGDLIVDLGCSRGEALSGVLRNRRCPSRVTAVGLEVSKPMLTAARTRFEGWESVTILDHDLRHGVPARCQGAQVMLSVLTVQFTPMQWRPHLLASIRQRLTPGGVFLFVEKVLGPTATIDRLLTDSYHELKREHGYSDEQIERKALALEGALVPLTAAMNEQLLRSAGFSEIDCIWRSGPFAAWAAL